MESTLEVDFTRASGRSKFSMTVIKMDVALTPLRQVVAGTSGGSEDNPIDALVIGAGPSGNWSFNTLNEKFSRC